MKFPIERKPQMSPVPGACPSNAMGPHLESEIVKKGHGKDIPRMDP